MVNQSCYDDCCYQALFQISDHTGCVCQASMKYGCFHFFFQFNYFIQMLINFNDFLAGNLFSNKYLKPVVKKNSYLFLLGLSLTIGDFKLILATIIFISSMVVSYQIKTKSTHNYLQYFRQFLTLENKQLLSSITIAGSFSIFTYFSLSVYSELDNLSLAIFVIIQTLFSTMGIIWFGKQLFSSELPDQNSQPLPINFNQLIQGLDDNSPVYRLWVINQMMSLWENRQLDNLQINQLEEYLQLSKNIECEPVILAKIDLSLEKLSFNNSQPLNITSKKYNLNRKSSLPVMQTVNFIQGE